MINDILKPTEKTQLEWAERYTRLLSVLLNDFSARLQSNLPRTRELKELNRVKLSVKKAPFLRPDSLDEEMKSGRDDELFEPLKNESPRNDRPR